MFRTETFYLGAFVGENPWNIPRFMCFRCVQRLFLGYISPNFILKILISTYLKDLNLKQNPNSPDFEGKKNKNC
jgi:hypothetical protein